MYGRGYLSEIAPTWAVFCPTLAFVVEKVYTLDKGVSPLKRAYLSIELLVIF